MWGLYCWEYSIELEQALSSSHISSRGTHTFFLCMSDALLLDDVAHWKIIVINIVFTSLFTGYKNNKKNLPTTYHSIM